MKLITIKFNAAICKVEGLNADLIETIKSRFKIDLPEDRYNDFKNKTKLPLTKEGDSYFLLEEFDNYINIPTGLLTKLVKYLKTIPLDYKLERRIDSTPLESKPYSSTLRNNQKQCVDKFLSRKRGILKAFTRFGKSYCLANFVNQFPTTINQLILVPGKSLLYQMQADIAKVLDITVDSIGLIGDGNYSIQPITIAIPDTLVVRLQDWNKETISYLQSIKVVVFDECHDCNNPSAVLISDYLTEAEYKIGMSATPYTAPFLILEGTIGEVILEFEEQEGIDSGVIDAPTILFHKLDKQVALTPQLANFKFNSGQFGNKEMFLYNKLKEQILCINPYRNELGVSIIKQRLAEGRTVLVLVDRVGTSGGLNHAQMIRDLLLKKGIDFPIVHGTTKNRESYYEKLESGELKGIIGSAGILTQGVTIKAVSSLVLLCGGSEKKALYDNRQVKNIVQRIGRTLTKSEGKLAPTIDDILDCQHIFASHAQSRLKAAITAYGENNVKVI